MKQVLLMLAICTIVHRIDGTTDGCIVDGVHYPVGEIPDNDPCGDCFCYDIGEVACTSVSCEAPSCSSPFSLTDRCCPVCPGDPCGDIFQEARRIKVGCCTLRCRKGVVKARCRRCP